jgi:hypothetical protein
METCSNCGRGVYLDGEGVVILGLGEVGGPKLLCASCAPALVTFEPGRWNAEKGCWEIGAA